MRRRVFSEVGDFWHSPKAADWDMWLRIAARYPIGLVAHPLARYRIHHKMITAGQSWEMAYNACITVIERAITLNPERLEPLRDKAIACLCIRTGRILSGMGRLKEARSMFARAIQYWPVIPQAYLFWVTTLLGGKILGKLIQINRLRRRALVSWTR